MRRRLLLLSLLLALSPAAAAERDYAQSAEALEELRDRIAEIDERLREAGTRRNRLREALEAAERAASKATAELAETKQELQRLEAREAKARQRVREAETALARHQQALADQLRAAWLLGRQPQTKLLLEQDAPARLSRMRAYFARMSAASADALERTRQAHAEQEAALQSLAETREELRAARAEQEALAAEQQRRREQRARTLAALGKRIADDKQALAQTRRDAEELEALLRGLREALADIPADAGAAAPLDQLRGELPWPLRGPVLAAFGQARASGLPWKGIWIAADGGARVGAVASGRVAWAGWMHRYGLVVILEHAGGFYSLYGHAERSLRRVGEWVEAGAAIITAGDSGGQSRSGVYLELRKGADALDPIAWLRPRN
ncbi:murein hydrolase activator EnvC family protein [Algiphilus aromaticivorans]|uniref:murein hydrolase activator EnvC family protein n=1 Tax=Algiphilus aromaticivorans TaxID=382454 RepID=UPI0005C25258|nr:peptidoglycan DD-metalloendopeptidase family protein [Algiphilus aromaticivorans]